MSHYNTNHLKHVSIRERWTDFIHGLQDAICEALEETDGGSRFIEDRWQRSGDGGGGISRIIENGRVFEKGGVNTSVVYGPVSDAMRKQLNIEGSSWFACGLSLVIHPLNPFVPTVHANWRYFELYDETGSCIDSPSPATHHNRHRRLRFPRRPE
jgi:coproporphyrinogen III oxidase